MRRRLAFLRVPGLLRLLALFAILIVPLLAGRLVQHLQSGEPLGATGAARPDPVKRS